MRERAIIETPSRFLIFTWMDGRVTKIKKRKQTLRLGVKENHDIYLRYSEFEILTHHPVRGIR